MMVGMDVVRLKQWTRKTLPARAQELAVPTDSRHLIVVMDGRGVVGDEEVPVGPVSGVRTEPGETVWLKAVTDMEILDVTFMPDDVVGEGQREPPWSDP
jgi:hypothetical protein